MIYKLAYLAIFKQPYEQTDTYLFAHRVIKPFKKQQKYEAAAYKKKLEAGKFDRNTKKHLFWHYVLLIYNVNRDIIFNSLLSYA